MATWDTVELSREMFYSDDPPHPGELVRRGATLTLTYRWADGRKRSFARCLRDRGGPRSNRRTRMSELPQIGQGHAPLDVCHRTHSGVAIHLMPGCVCDVPSQLLDIVEHNGTVVGQHEVKVSNHVNVHEAGGKSRSISLEQARNAGHIN